MRQKLIGRVRQPERVAPAGTAEDPARWLVRNEIGWGMPHGPIEWLVALGWGYLAVGVARWIGVGLRPRR